MVGTEGLGVAVVVVAVLSVISGGIEAAALVLGMGAGGVVFEGVAFCDVGDVSEVTLGPDLVSTAGGGETVFGGTVAEVADFSVGGGFGCETTAFGDDGSAFIEGSVFAEGTAFGAEDPDFGGEGAVFGGKGIAVGDEGGAFGVAGTGFGIDGGGFGVGGADFGTGGASFTDEGVAFADAAKDVGVEGDFFLVGEAFGGAPS